MFVSSSNVDAKIEKTEGNYNFDEEWLNKFNGLPSRPKKRPRESDPFSLDGLLGLDNKHNPSMVPNNKQNDYKSQEDNKGPKEDGIFDLNNSFHFSEENKEGTEKSVDGGQKDESNMDIQEEKLEEEVRLTKEVGEAIGINLSKMSQEILRSIENEGNNHVPR